MGREQPALEVAAPDFLVLSYLIGDDSTMAKPYAARQAGLGWHHSTTAERRVWAHSLSLVHASSHRLPGEPPPSPAVAAISPGDQPENEPLSP